MKHLRQFCVVVALTLALAFPVSAGDIYGGAVSTPPTATAAAEMPGEIMSPPVAAPGESTEPALEFLLEMLQMTFEILS